MRMSYTRFLVLACTLFLLFLGLQPTNSGPVPGASSLSAGSADAGAAAAAAAAHGQAGAGIGPGAGGAAAAMGQIGGGGPGGNSLHHKINGGKGHKSAGPSHSKRKGSKKTNHRGRAASHGHHRHLGRSGTASIASLRLKSRGGMF